MSESDGCTVEEIPSDQNNDPEEEKKDAFTDLVDKTKQKLMQKPKSIDLAALDEGVEGESQQ